MLDAFPVETLEQNMLDAFHEGFGTHVGCIPVVFRTENVRCLPHTFWKRTCWMHVPQVLEKNMLDAFPVGFGTEREEFCQEKHVVHKEMSFHVYSAEELAHPSKVAPAFAGRPNNDALF